jgi:hypothetical protein
MGAFVCRTSRGDDVSRISRRRTVAQWHAAGMTADGLRDAADPDAQAQELVLG